jgi:ribosomal protein S18 acetylase RimI-like enzyme
MTQSDSEEVIRMQIRYMTEEDLSAILQMTLDEGWISDLSEFRMFIKFNPRGCFVCTEDARVIGSIMTFCHSKSAWISNFIVAKEHQAKGIGKELLLRAINYLKKEKKGPIFLNAAEQTEELYERFGFKRIMPVNRWLGRVVKLANSVENLSELIPGSARFIELDASLWREERFFLISRFLSSRNFQVCFEPFGFLMYGGIRDFITIGPWELESEKGEIAEKLFVSALSDLELESKIILDVPSTNKMAEKILKKYKFEIISSTLFMCRGKVPEIHFGRIFSFASMGSMG